MNRSLLGRLALAAGVAMAVGAAPAAAETVGSPSGSGLFEGCTQKTEVIGSATFTRPGFVTQFRYRSLSSSTDAAALQVVRPESQADTFTVVGSVDVTGPATSSIVTVPAGFFVQPGDRLAIFVKTSTRDPDFSYFPCVSTAADFDDSAFLDQPAAGQTFTLSPNVHRDNRHLNLEATTRPLTDTFFVDAYSPSKKTPQVSTGNLSLPEGDASTVSVQGTATSFAASLMAPDGERTRNIAICGSPEASATFGSPSANGGRVGQDPQYLFAYPQLGNKCNPKNAAVLPYRQSSVQFSVDGGLSWFTPSALQSTKTDDHTYTYTIQGADQPLRVRFPDSYYLDNSGRFKVVVTLP